MHDARSTHTQGAASRGREVASRDSRARAIGTARLVLAGLATVLLAVGVWGRLGEGVWMALAADLAVFVALVFVHARVFEAKERAAAAFRFHERALARLDHAWDKLAVDSERLATPDHPYSKDLDIFGHGSLMQLVDSTETRFGQEHLARLLSLENPGEWPVDVAARQAAVRDLSVRTSFREALAAAGGVLADERPDPAPVLAWAEEKGGLPAWLGLTGWVIPLATAASVTAALAANVPSRAIIAIVVAAIVAGVAAGVRLTPLLAAVSAREGAVTRWRAMLAIIENERFEAPLLVALRDRLTVQGRRASDEIAALERIVGFVDARLNEVFRLLVGPLLMWDVHCATALLRWRTRAGARVRPWLQTLGEVEALAALAGFAFENAAFTWPSLGDDAGVEARGLGHPLLAGDQRVGNDVHLPTGGRALVVTGSNMSGKSTLLRAVGVNAVLAFAGAPVCAAAMRIGPARVATSMRIEDSLEQGVSHFYAELRRLKRVLDLSRSGGAPALFLLDEILHGTNSRERVIGACAVVRELLRAGALGAVSTHDLGITALEQELGGRVENVHFEEQVRGEAMTFDYVLRPGIVHSSNALRLMKAVGIDVPLEAQDPGETSDPASSTQSANG